MQVANKNDVVKKGAAQGEPLAGGKVIAWKPQWLIDIEHDDVVGLTMRDGCFVVLVRKPDATWEPTTHIPRQAAERIAQLLPGIAPR